MSDGYLSKKQVDLLLQPIHRNRVLVRDGMSYVEAYDIRAELNRVFGFCRWGTHILSQELLFETQTKTSKGKDAWYVAYKTSLRLEVWTPDGDWLCAFEESHVGESTHPVRGEAHGNALTNSHSYALKRCAHNLGDQFGLSLYNKGSLDKVVRWTLVTAPEDGKPDKVDTNDVPQVTAENGNGNGSGGEAITGADWYRWLVDDLIPAAKDQERLNSFWAAGLKKHEDGELTKEQWEEIKAFIRERAREVVPPQGNGQHASEPAEASS